MATIKSYTNIEQSKKLAEFLPIESADMYYHYVRSVVKDYHKDIPECIELTNHFVFFPEDIPCWSLTALLSVLPNYQLQTQDDGIGILCSYNGKFNIVTTDNPVDACYEMIIKLHELKDAIKAINGK